MSFPPLREACACNEPVRCPKNVGSQFPRILGTLIDEMAIQDKSI